MTAQILTQARLRELLYYDPDIGIFTWRVQRGSAKKGAIVGTAHNKGYLQVRLDKKTYLVHRLAWFYVQNDWPAEETDHINGIKTDNRIINLRMATHKENQENRDAQGNNTSGYKGVTWSNKSQKWQAQICHNGARKQLGVFTDLKTAHEAYLAAADELFTHKDRIFKE